jgi:ABC-type nitrate/sulfonate/bicarbonate transport system permease component
MLPLEKQPETGVSGSTNAPAALPRLIQESAPQSQRQIEGLGSVWIQRLWVPVTLIAAWELAVRLSLLDALFFPAPSTLFAASLEMLRHGDLGHRVGQTLTRAGTGFLIGALAGILCGAAMGAVKIVRRALSPLVAALYNSPKLTLLPMLMILVGTGETARLILIAASAFLLVVMHTHDGVQRVSPHYVELAANHGATRWLLFRHVYLPASLPQIFTGLRLGMGRALGIAISCELLTGAGGLGGLVSKSWQGFAMEQLYVAVIVAALLGASIHGGLKLLETRLLPWRNE